MKKMNIKTTINKYPEFFLIPAILFYWMSAAIVYNPFAIGLLSFLLAIHLFSLKIVGRIFSVVFIILNLYMILAMLSELSEFPVFNMKAFYLLSVGSFFIGYNIFFGVKVFIKHSLENTNMQLQVNT